MMQISPKKINPFVPVSVSVYTPFDPSKSKIICSSKLSKSFPYRQFKAYAEGYISLVAAAQQNLDEGKLAHIFTLASVGNDAVIFQLNKVEYKIHKNLIPDSCIYGVHPEQTIKLSVKMDHNKQVTRVSLLYNFGLECFAITCMIPLGSDAVVLDLDPVASHAKAIINFIEKGGNNRLNLAYHELKNFKDLLTAGDVDAIARNCIKKDDYDSLYLAYVVLSHVGSKLTPENQAGYINTIIGALTKKDDYNSLYLAYIVLKLLGNNLNIDEKAEHVKRLVAKLASNPDPRSHILARKALKIIGNSLDAEDVKAIVMGYIDSGNDLGKLNSARRALEDSGSKLIAEDIYTVIVKLIDKDYPDNLDLAHFVLATLGNRLTAEHINTIIAKLTDSNDFNRLELAHFVLTTLSSDLAVEAQAKYVKIIVDKLFGKGDPISRDLARIISKNFGIEPPSKEIIE